MAVDPASTDTVSRAPSVARAASILRLLSREQAAIGVNEIARRLGLVPSTCLHILRTLIDEDLVAFDPERKTYRIGAGLLWLVRDAMASNGFQRAVQPHLDRLAAAYDITAIAVELDSRDRPVVVALARAASLVSLHVDVGTRFPAFVSATGRCVAAGSELSPDELRRRFDDLRWETPPLFEDWVADIERVAVDGVAIDVGNFARGITVLAGLVPNGRRRRTQGIALVGLEHRLTDHVTDELRRELRDTARVLGTVA